MPFKDKESKRLYDLQWAKTPKGRAVSARSRQKMKEKLANMPPEQQAMILEKKREYSINAYYKRVGRERGDRKAQKKRAYQRKAELVAAAKAAGCKYCGEMAKVCLEFHHRDPKQKNAIISQLLDSGASVTRIVAELELCDVICANCHRKIHQGHLRLLPQNSETAVAA